MSEHKWLDWFPHQSHGKWLIGINLVDEAWRTIGEGETEIEACCEAVAELAALQSALIRRISKKKRFYEWADSAKDAEIERLKEEVQHWRSRVPISRQISEYDIATNTAPYAEDLDALEGE